MKRNFEAAKLKQKKVTDVTEFCLFGQKRCLSPAPGLCSRDIISYTISGRPMLPMVTFMPDKAFTKVQGCAKLISTPIKAGSTNTNSTKKC
ncbi:MAG: hypothetical protein Q4G07_00835 [Oscillospiraceae bacterium]|nr:hypothetical protein [Oscillospiraceae bacterium]